MHRTHLFSRHPNILCDLRSFFFIFLFFMSLSNLSFAYKYISLPFIRLPYREMYTANCKCLQERKNGKQAFVVSVLHGAQRWALIRVTTKMWAIHKRWDWWKTLWFAFIHISSSSSLLTIAPISPRLSNLFDHTLLWMAVIAVGNKWLAPVDKWSWLERCLQFEYTMFRIAWLLISGWEDSQPYTIYYIISYTQPLFFEFLNSVGTNTHSLGASSPFERSTTEAHEESTIKIHNVTFSPNRKNAGSRLGNGKAICIVIIITRMANSCQQQFQLKCKLTNECVRYGEICSAFS